MTEQSKIKVPALSRRHFFITAGAAGLAMGYAAMPEPGSAATAAPLAPTVWYAIGTDGKVVVTCGKAEMGQHISSTMAQLVAEELGASWKDMSVVLASNDQRGR